MGEVTELHRTSRRLDNPKSQLGRVYQVMRDATYWLQLHEIGDAIEARFRQKDSHAAISARIRELRSLGQTIISREKPGPGTTRPHEYRLLDEWDGGDGGAA